MILCVDANVFVAASTAREVHFLDSRAFFDRADHAGIPVVSPSLLIAEVAAAIARQSGDSGLARQTVAIIRRSPNLGLLGLDAARADQAAEQAIRLRLRGADAVYAQVALELDAVLITWDSEMLQRVSPAVSAMTPGQWISAQT
jgi:predicted nucleic acid-binding protein